jgi:DNA-binding MarR family transcriptional regulator
MMKRVNAKTDARMGVRKQPRDHVDTRLEELCDDLPDLDLDVEGIVERIQGLEKRLKQAMEETLEEHGLSYGEWRVLCNLHSSHDRTSTPGELSAKLELSSGAMTNRIDRLEEDGLVVRRRDPDDRRGVRVALTDDGGKAWVVSTNTQAIKEKLIAGALSKAEQQQLNTLLRKLMLSFDAAARQDG